MFIRYDKSLPPYLVDTLIGYASAQMDLEDCFQTYFSLAKGDPFVLKKREGILNEMYQQLTASKKEQKSYWRYKLLCGEVATIYAHIGDLGKAYSAIRLPIDQSAGYNERTLVGDQYFIVGELELYGTYQKREL